MSQRQIEAALEEYVEELKFSINRSAGDPRQNLLEERLLQALRMLGLLRVELNLARFKSVLKDEEKYWEREETPSNMGAEVHAKWNSFRHIVELGE